jgi:hypothetical protein
MATIIETSPRIVEQVFNAKTEEAARFKEIPITQDPKAFVQALESMTIEERAALKRNELFTTYLQIDWLNYLADLSKINKTTADHLNDPTRGIEKTIYIAGSDGKTTLIQNTPREIQIVHRNSLRENDIITVTFTSYFTREDHKLSRVNINNGATRFKCKFNIPRSLE